MRGPSSTVNRRSPRRYLKFLDSSQQSLEAGVGLFNQPNGPHRNAATLILVASAWELLAKAVLIRRGKKIEEGRSSRSISAERAIHQLRNLGVLDEHEGKIVQQVISLRNSAAHEPLPAVPIEIMQHLLFFAVKAYRRVVSKEFPRRHGNYPDHFLAMSFGDLTTYADHVAKSISRAKKNEDDLTLVWLLERGVVFDGTSYQSRKQVENRLRAGKRRRKLNLDTYMSEADMIRLVPVEAPRNATGDLRLRKGSKGHKSLPVIVEYIPDETRYPYFTRDLARNIGKSQDFVARTVRQMGWFHDEEYHKSVRVSSKGMSQRYSEKTLYELEKLLKAQPNYKPSAMTRNSEKRAL